MPQLHRRDRASAASRLLLEARDAPGGVVDHDAVVRGVVDLFDGDGGDAAVRAVGGHERRDVDVGQGVAAHHQEGVVAEQLAKPAGAAGGAQQLLFEAVVGVQAKGPAVAEVAPDVVGVVVQVDADLGHAVARQQPQDVLHHRTIDDGRHGLGGAVGERRQAGAQTGRHDVRLGRPGGRRLIRRTSPFEAGPAQGLVVGRPQHADLGDDGADVGLRA